MKYRVCAALAAFLSIGIAIGCNADPGADNGMGIDEPAPLPAPTMTAPKYPPGPYAVTRGAIIPNFSFSGFIGGKTSPTITLEAFYNPHAGDPTYQPADPSTDDRLFPAGSPYGAGTNKPTALLVDIASVWCGPCNEEAKNTLNGLYAKYKPCGGEFLFQLAEGSAPGVPVTEQTLKAWVSLYKVTYPATWDPQKQLFPLYSADSFPDSAIIDTRTMKIVDVISGVPDTTFWTTYESLLDASCLAAGE